MKLAWINTPIRSNIVKCPILNEGRLTFKQLNAFYFSGFTSTPTAYMELRQYNTYISYCIYTSLSFIPLSQYM